MINQGEYKNMLSRYRSPVFSKAEIKTLVDIVDKYKIIILNKSVSGNSCRAKEVAWANITKLFNKSGFENQRNTESLRTKWENLKREARKVNKNLLDGGENDCDDIINQVVAMISMEVNKNNILLPEELEDNNEGVLRLGLEELQEDNSAEYSESGANGGLYPEIIPGGENETEYKIKHQVKNESDSHSEEATPRNNRVRFVSRSKNFSLQESSLLLKCVRAEKKYVFNIGTSPAMMMLKNRAWARITHAFNKQSQQKRSINCLRTKFINMKRLGTKLGIMHKKIETRNCDNLGENDYKAVEEDIKAEPKNYSDQEDNVSSDGGHNDSLDEPNDMTYTFRNHVSPDPLSVNITNNSKNGICDIESSRNPEDNEVSKLKLQFLKCQFENAQLEKKRLEDAIRAEASAIEMRATEMALRLRAARLEVAAAALKLPNGHPALLYTLEEKRAEDYINSCQQ